VPSNAVQWEIPAPESAPIKCAQPASIQRRKLSDAHYGALTYNWLVMLAAAPTVVVQEIETSTSYVTFPNLPPGQVCIVQANAVGTAGTSDWSPTTSRMVV